LRSETGPANTSFPELSTLQSAEGDFHVMDLDIDDNEEPDVTHVGDIAPEDSEFDDIILQMEQAQPRTSSLLVVN
jgi:hypothetical protein